MKTRNLFLSLFAFAAICACNKEAQPETPQVLGEDACLSVRIMAADVNTKADDGGFAIGTEHEVKNVLFAFFDEAGKFMYTREYTDDFSWGEGTKDNPHVEDYSNATVVLDGKSIVPRQMVVVLNYDNTLKTAIDGLKATNGTVADMYSTLTTNYYTTHDATSYFVMTNSSYVAAGDATGKNAFAAQIKSTDIYNKDAKPDPVPVVDVYVERVAAKLSVTTSNELNTTTKTLDLINGETVSYYPDIEGYAFTTTRTSSYLCKNIDEITINDWTWNDPTNKRSYWGNTYVATPENLAYVNYEEDENQWHESGYYTYCNENMTTTHTKLIVKATIKQQMGATQNPSGDPALNLVKVGDKYYLESELKDAIIAELIAGEVKWNNSGVETDYVASDLVFEATLGSGYQVDVKLESSKPVVADKETAANSILDKYKSLLRWNAGQCYFFTDIQHLGTPATNSDYGVVRNHVYNLTVKSISGLGTPFVPGVGGDGGDPVVPEEIDYELQAQINILKWKVVNQNVDLQ